MTRTDRSRMRGLTGAATGLGLMLCASIASAFPFNFRPLDERDVRRLPLEAREAYDKALEDVDHIFYDGALRWMLRAADAAPKSAEIRFQVINLALYRGDTHPDLIEQSRYYDIAMRYSLEIVEIPNLSPRAKGRGERLLERLARQRVALPERDEKRRAYGMEIAKIYAEETYQDKGTSDEIEAYRDALKRLTEGSATPEDEDDAAGRAADSLSRSSDLGGASVISGTRGESKEFSPEVEAVFDQASDAYAGSESQSMDFTMEMTLPGVETEAAGVITTKGEGLMRQTLEMNVLGQVIKVTSVIGPDGILWSETVAAGQTHVVKIDAAAMAQGGSLSGDAMGGMGDQMAGQSPRSMIEQFRSMFDDAELREGDEVEGESVNVIAGKAAEGAGGDIAGAAIELAIGADDGFLRRLSISAPDGSMEMAFIFKNIQTDVDIDDSIFDYAPPPGAAVQDLTGAMAPPRSGESDLQAPPPPVSQVPDDELIARATRFVEAASSGDLDAAREHMSEGFEAKMTEEAIAQMQTQLQAFLGEFEGVNGAEIVEAGEDPIVDVKAQFTNGEFTLAVTFNNLGLIDNAVPKLEPPQ